jgi:hypothetical protein
MQETLAHARAITRYMQVAGKPVVLQECGWYGGGAVFIAGREQPYRTQEDQTAWCRGLAEATRGDVCGWLFWPYRDTPSSLDSSRFSGFFTTEGQIKDWGRAFSAMAPQVTAGIPARQKGTHSLAVNHERLVTDPQYVKEFRKEYLQAFRQGEVVAFEEQRNE